MEIPGAPVLLEQLTIFGPPVRILCSFLFSVFRQNILLSSEQQTTSASVSDERLTAHQTDSHFRLRNPNFEVQNTNDKKVLLIG